jgi:hypothetical protein
MDVTGLVEALKKSPFEPFTIHLADGRTMSVRHPEFVAAHPRRIIVVHEDATWSVIEPLLIVSLEYGNGDKGGNGTTRRKKRGSGGGEKN